MHADSRETGHSHPHPHVKGYWRRHAASLARWLHIYLSMVSFAILAFFAVTGLTLNHADAFASKRQNTSQLKGTLPVEWLKGKEPNPVAKLEIVEQLRSRHGVRGLLGEFRVEDTQCAVSFRGPGYSADAFINREDGTYELSETRPGLVAVINDLHKGRDTGTAWSWVIDASAVLMTLVSLSGMVLIVFIKRRRVTGLVAAVVGAATCWAIYALWVP